MSNLTKDGYWTLKVVVKYYQIMIKEKGAPTYIADPRAGFSGVGYWENFRVADETESFKLTIGRQIRADNMDERDPLTQDGRSFSTKDRDNDQSRSNCADDYNSGWWYDNCFKVCLNCEGKTIRQRKVPNWYDGKNILLLSESAMWIKRNE